MPGTSAPATHITGVRTIGIPVRDQDKALEFYTSVLGFTERLDIAIRQETRWIEVSPSTDGPSIALVKEHDDVRPGVETGIRLITADADADHDALLARGVEVGELLRWPGVPPMFSFRDQDGNSLELVQQP
ncbi:MAG TPA: VOC family protein [Streptosporangiaceae bacterium]|nr:VOC family protein [Streptosporangiaceae bacterium]